MRRGLKVKRAGTSFREAGPHPAVEDGWSRAQRSGRHGSSWRGERAAGASRAAQKLETREYVCC